MQGVAKVSVAGSGTGQLTPKQAHMDTPPVNVASEPLIRSLLNLQPDFPTPPRLPPVVDVIVRKTPSLTCRKSHGSGRNDN